MRARGKVGNKHKQTNLLLYPFLIKNPRIYPLRRHQPNECTFTYTHMYSTDSKYADIKFSVRGKLLNRYAMCINERSISILVKKEESPFALLASHTHPHHPQNHSDFTKHEYSWVPRLTWHYPKNSINFLCFFSFIWCASRNITWHICESFPSSSLFHFVIAICTFPYMWSEMSFRLKQYFLRFFASNKKEKKRISFRLKNLSQSFYFIYFQYVMFSWE